MSSYAYEMTMRLIVAALTAFLLFTAMDYWLEKK